MDLNSEKGGEHLGTPTKYKSGKGGYIFAIFFLPILSAAIAGIGVYYILISNLSIVGIGQEMDASALEKQLEDKDSEAAALRARLDAVEEELAAKKITLDVQEDAPVLTESLVEPCEIEEDLPVVTYERAGLLTDQDREELQTKLIDPFFDYYNEEELDMIAMIITAPVNGGDEYEIRYVSHRGSGGGFLYGARGEILSWWAPDCLDACEFSESFSAQYPEVVAAAGS